MATKRNKPPAPCLEQEAKAFVEGRKITTKARAPEGLSPSRAAIAASVLAGLLASSSSRARAEELVEEAYRYADLVLKYSK